MMRQLLSQQQIESRIGQIADQLNADYAGKTLDIVCILKGAMIFTSDLIRRLTVPVRLHFVQISSYGSRTESSGTVSIHFSSFSEWKNLHLLVVEDILDTGITLDYLMEHLKEKDPASLKSCVLLDKPARRRVLIDVNYSGFVIENHFVVGYGLDFNELYRNMPYIAVLDE